MKKKKIIPKSLECIISVLAVVVLFMVCVFSVMTIMNSCHPKKVKEQINAYTLQQENEALKNQIYAYNNLIHRIWIDNPNYVEDVLCECDEWICLDQLVDGDFCGAFELNSKEDSLLYNKNTISE